MACDNDLEGLVAKRKSDPYLPEHAQWLKIRNHNYSQWAGREELFQRELGGDSDFQVWNSCALACEVVESIGEGSESTLALALTSQKSD